MPNSIDDLRRLAATEPNLALRTGYLAALTDAEKLHKGEGDNAVLTALALAPQLTEALDTILNSQEKRNPNSQDFARLVTMLRGLKVRVEEVLHDAGAKTRPVYDEE